MTAKSSAPKSKPAAKRAPVQAAVPAKVAAAAPKAEAPKTEAPKPAAPKPAAPIKAAAPLADVVKAAPAQTAPIPAPIPAPVPAPIPAPVPEPVVAAAPVKPPVAAPAAAPATVVPIANLITAKLLNPLDLVKEPIMATAFETTTDAVKNTVNTLNAQTEAAVNNGKAAMEQVAAKSKEAVEASMKSLDELSDMARANVDALIASARVATAGVEQVMTHLTEVSKSSFEATTAAVKGLAAAKTPNELMQLQSDFAKAQFDHAVSEYSKLSEMMVKLAGEVMEPVQNQVALATDKMKAAFTTK
jgi:phasin family protein